MVDIKDAGIKTIQTITCHMKISASTVSDCILFDEKKKEVVPEKVTSVTARSIMARIEKLINDLPDMKEGNHTFVISAKLGE